MRPPSIGKAGSRLKTRTRALIEASQPTIAITPETPESDSINRPPELVRADRGEADGGEDDDDRQGDQRARRSRP